WNTRTGFVLATIGCAAGLGNIWRFSYVAGESGGAAFLIVYALCVALLGVPLMLGEFCIGRRAQADAVAAFNLGGAGRG
ncbi:MAG: sodium-dependent transporter, partial [Burkholderiales bacterium]|nr:sodium-dependent transporter [Burkholderiales bacterium]